MTNKTNRMFLEKLGGSNPTSFVGTAGEIFYDPTTGFFRLSDGSTPGGILLNMIGRQGYCGSFYDTTTQTNLATVNKIKLNTSDISDGVSVVSNSRITFAHAGRYDIQFSFQLDKTDSGSDEIELWLSKNGSNVDNTNTNLHLDGNSVKIVAAWNFVVDVAVNDYYEICWYSADPNIRIVYEAAKTNPTRPAIPSAIVTVTQV